jgi:hypothetical protein
LPGKKLTASYNPEYLSFPVQQKLPRRAILLAAVTALAAWFAIIDQIYFVITGAEANHLAILQVLGRFWSFGTMLTNLLVAVSLSVVLIKPNSAAGNFFSKPIIVTGVALYILLVFFGFNIFLRHLHHLHGWKKLDSELLHVAVPALYFLYWILFASKTSLQWKHALLWLAGPVIYFIFILVRGAMDGFYPYPMVDVNELGYSRVILFAAGAGIAIIILGWLLIAIARLQKRNA